MHKTWYLNQNLKWFNSYVSKDVVSCYNANIYIFTQKNGHFHFKNILNNNEH